MATSPRMLARTFLESRPCLHWPALAVLTAFALTPPIVAFFFPLEIEWRESTVWLHVLTLREGINLYDHSKVAYVNMNHGPIDPLLKYGLSTILPGLEPWMVTRAPALLLPGVILLATFLNLRRRSDRPLFDAGLCTAALYISLLALGTGFPLVGRSDPTALLLCAVLMGVLRPGEITGVRARAVRGVLAGIVVGALAMTNLRYLPVLGGLIVRHRADLDRDGRRDARAHRWMYFWIDRKRTPLNTSHMT